MMQSLATASYTIMNKIIDSGRSATPELYYVHNKKGGKTSHFFRDYPFYIDI